MRELGVHSEVGKLRTVLVCRPSLAHQRLTPGNCRDLLFDDVIWVHEAQKDHHDLVLKMEERGVEVLELHDLLAETLDDPEARAFVLDRRVTPNTVGINVGELMRPWLDEMPSKLLAAHLIGGIAIADLPDATATAMLREAFGGTAFMLPPIPNSLFQRDPSCWIYKGVTCNPMFWPARKPETLLQRAVYKFHPRFRKADFKIWWGDSDEDFTGATLEGGDVMAVGKGVVLVGMGERTSRQAVSQITRELFRNGAASRVIACLMPIRSAVTAPIPSTARATSRCGTRRSRCWRSPPKHWIFPSSAPSAPVATPTRLSASNGTTATTSSLSSPAWWWPTTATPTPTRCCARPASRSSPCAARNSAAAAAADTA